MNDKLPPHSVESEQAILGGLLISDRQFDEVAALVTEESFYRASHRLIWRAQAHLIGRGQPADVVTIAEFLEKHDKIEDAGGRAYLGELAKNVPSASNIMAYAKIVRQHWFLRKGIGFCSEYNEQAYNGGDPEQAIGELQSKLANLTERAQTSVPTPMAEGLSAWVDQLEKRHERGDDIAGASTGLADLDKFTGGLEPENLIIVAGRPSMGKSSLAFQISDHIAEKQGGWSLVFSMEMSRQELISRSISSLGNLDSELFRHPSRMTGDDWRRVVTAVPRVKDRRVLIDDSPALRVTELRARAKAMARKYTLNVIMVDYIQLMQADSKENRNLQITEISAGLKQLAKELHVPVIALSQLNRGLEQRQNKRPMMSDLRESGALEQDADVIAFIYRDEQYNTNSPMKGVAEIIIGKQRNGPTGTVYTNWDGRYTRFQNLAPGWQKPEPEESPRKPKPFYERAANRGAA